MVNYAHTSLQIEHQVRRVKVAVAKHGCEPLQLRRKLRKLVGQPIILNLGKRHLEKRFEVVRLEEIELPHQLFPIKAEARRYRCLLVRERRDSLDKGNQR